MNLDVIGMRIVLELEAADPEALLSSEALKALITLSRAGVAITRLDPAEGGADTPVVDRMREILVSRGRR